MESIKEDAKDSREDKRLLNENVEECNPINLGVVSRGELYLINLFFI